MRERDCVTQRETARERELLRRVTQRVSESLAAKEKLRVTQRESVSYSQRERGRESLAAKEKLRVTQRESVSYSQREREGKRVTRSERET